MKAVQRYSYHNTMCIMYIVGLREYSDTLLGYRLPAPEAILPSGPVPMLDGVT